MQTPHGEKRLDELRYGDEVRVVALESGATSFEPVDSFVRPPSHTRSANAAPTA